MALAHDALLDRIYGAVGDPAGWPAILVDIADHLGAQGGMLAQVGATRTRSAFVHARLSDPHFELFETRHLWNPWTQAMRRAPLERVVIMGSVVDRTLLGRTAFHADVLAPQRTVDQLNFSLRCLGQEGGVGGMGFPFDAARAGQLEIGARKLQRLVPHLRRAFEASVSLGRREREQDLDVTLSLMANPALLLDERGRVVFANAAAERLLRAGDGLVAATDGGLHLSATLPGEAAALRLRLAAAIAVTRGEDVTPGEAIRISRPSGKPALVAFAVPLPARAFPFCAQPGDARAILLVVDPASEPLADLETVRTAFDLTHAEARVAQLVGAGHSTPAAATRLAIAPSTVRTHLQRCFEKTGVRSQPHLARLLGALPAGRRRSE